MSLTPVVVENFKGLRLLPEQGEATGAVSMLNIDFTRGPTQIGTRGGLSRLATGTASYQRIAPVTSDRLLLMRNTGSALTTERLTISTATVAAVAPASWGSASTVTTSTTSGGSGALYIASRSGASNENLRSWATGTGAIAVTTSPSGNNTAPRYLAHMTDGRTAIAHFTDAAGTPSGSNGTTSTVFFSDPDLPNTYQADNWVELDPNDGDDITGMVAWRELLFVVKRRYMYVFYSTSIDSTGSPIFNFRRIDLPARARATTNGGGENIIAGGDGVYLLLSDGVYKTTGDIPQMVSRDIAPLFDGTGDASMLFPSSGDWTIGYATNRVYLSYTLASDSTDRTLVYDTILGEWLFWDLSVDSAVLPTNVIEWVDTNGLPTAYIASGAKVFSLTKTATSDDGTAIVSSYQSGFDGLGFPSQEKKIRNVEVVGSGSPTLTVLTDYATSDPLSRQGTVTLGTAPAVDGATHAKAYRGRLFAYKFSASSGAWSATRLTWNVQSVRPVGMRSA